MRILGIDPGISGGLSIVEGPRPIGSRIIDAISVPTIGLKAKRRVDVIAVVAFIQQYAPDAAVIERAQAMPDQGASSGFIYGRAVGALEACVMGMQIPLEVIEASAWKKAFGLSSRTPSGEKLTTSQIKEQSRQRVLMMYPKQRGFFERVSDHNRAESVLIAAYGLMVKDRC